MAKKTHKSSDTIVGFLQEPVAAYQKVSKSATKEWNPNVPFHGTQEEWWDHFHQIETGPFTPLEIANQEFEEWRKKFLASRL